MKKIYKYISLILLSFFCICLAFAKKSFTESSEKEGISKLNAWESGLKEKYASESEEKKLFDYYQLQFPKNINPAEKIAQDLIISGNKDIKEGRRLMKVDDSEVKSFKEGGGYRIVSRENVREEGRYMLSRGIENVIKGKALQKVIKDTINTLVKPEMVRDWTFKNNKTIRGAIVELEDNTVRFISKKMNYSEFDISSLCDKDIEYILTPKFDMEIETQDDILAGKLLSGKREANPIKIKITPKINNLVKNFPLKMEIEPDKDLVGKYNKIENISLNKNLLFIPDLDWNIDKLKILDAQDSIKFDMKISMGEVVKNRKAIFGVKPPLVHANLYFFTMFNKKVFPSSLLCGVDFTSENGKSLFPFREKIKNPSQDINVLLSANPFIGVKVKIDGANGYDFSNLKIDIKTDSDFFQKTITNIEIPLKDENKKEFYAFPNIAWNFEKLKTVKEPTIINVEISYKVDNQDEKFETTQFLIHPTNDVLMRAKDPVFNVARNYDNMFAAFVNEYHQDIEDIKQEALKLNLVDSFSGEQEGIDGIMKQLNAIWTVLQKRGVKYSSYTESIPSNDENFVCSQRVRFIDESIGFKQANCADGSILLASIFKNIGLNSCLIVAPGHMYCGIIFDNKIYPIETTLIGFEKTLQEAVIAGLKHFEKREQILNEVEAVDKICGISYDVKNKILDDFRIIDISRCRNMGILPIKSRNSKK